MLLLIDHSYIKFMDDMFLSELIVRFVFFMWVMRNHAGFKVPFGSYILTLFLYGITYTEREIQANK